jgi:hypothetical protein
LLELCHDLAHLDERIIQRQLSAPHVRACANEPGTRSHSVYGKPNSQPVSRARDVLGLAGVAYVEQSLGQSGK